MLIEVARTEPPKEGKKLGKVFTVTGLELQCWPDRLPDFQAGTRHEVEIAENEFNHRIYKKIIKAKPVANGNGASPPAPAPSNGTGEREFVRDLLVAAIGVGAVPFASSELRIAIAMLRSLWREIA